MIRRPAVVFLPHRVNAGELAEYVVVLAYAVVCQVHFVVELLAYVLKAGIGRGVVGAVFPLPHFAEGIVADLFAVLCVHLMTVLNISSSAF